MSLVNSLFNAGEISVMTRGDTGLAATNVDSSVVLDMSGYEGCMFICSLVETTAGASTTAVQLVARHADTNASTALTDLGSTSKAGSLTLGTGNQQTAFVVDVVKPVKRYLGVSVDKPGAGTSQVGPVIAIQYNARNVNKSSTAYVADGNVLISPTT